jgi:hypothetical protein
MFIAGAAGLGTAGNATQIVVKKWLTALQKRWLDVE